MNLRAREFDLWFGVRAPARISFIHTSEIKHLAMDGKKHSSGRGICTRFHNEREINIWAMDEKKTFAHFRTVSGLQNLVHSLDAKPQIKFACPKHDRSESRLQNQSCGSIHFCSPSRIQLNNIGVNWEACLPSRHISLGCPPAHAREAAPTPVAQPRAQG